MTPEERQRIEAIRERFTEHPWMSHDDSAWLLELVERQEAEITEMREREEPNPALLFYPSRKPVDDPA